MVGTYARRDVGRKTRGGCERYWYFIVRPACDLRCCCIVVRTAGLSSLVAGIYVYASRIGLEHL